MINVLDLAGFVTRGFYPLIVQVGVGGTGGYLVQHISQMFSIFNQQGHYVIADPDIVEEKNLKNQLFIKSDIGKSKAEVLAKRYSAAYQVSIAHYSENYIENVETLKSLFNVDYLRAESHATVYLPILIGSVDNNFTRQIMHEFYESVGRLLYIDVGNESVTLPNDFTERPMEEWTTKEKERYESSGWSGQVVCGLKYDFKTIQPPVAEVFPDILEDTDEIAPSEVACSDLIASDPQRLITNRMAALSVATYLNELFQSKTITNHMTFFHAKEGYMTSQQSIRQKNKKRPA